MLARRTLTDKFWQGPWHCRLALCNPRSSLLEKEHACLNPFIKRCDLLNISCVACNGKGGMQRCNVEAAPSVRENRSLKRTGKAYFCSRSTFGRRGLQAADERVAAEQYAAPYLDSGPGRSKRLRTDVGVGGMKVRLRASGVHCAH